MSSYELPDLELKKTFESITQIYNGLPMEARPEFLKFLEKSSMIFITSYYNDRDLQLIYKEDNLELNAPLESIKKLKPIVSLRLKDYGLTTLKDLVDYIQSGGNLLSIPRMKPNLIESIYNFLQGNGLYKRTPVPNDESYIADYWKEIDISTFDVLFKKGIRTVGALRNAYLKNELSKAIGYSKRSKLASFLRYHRLISDTDEA